MSDASEIWGEMSPSNRNILCVKNCDLPYILPEGLGVLLWKGRRDQRRGDYCRGHSVDGRLGLGWLDVLVFGGSCCWLVRPRLYHSPQSA